MSYKDTPTGKTSSWSIMRLSRGGRLFYIGAIRWEDLYRVNVIREGGFIIYNDSLRTEIFSRVGGGNLSHVDRWRLACVE